MSQPPPNFVSASQEKKERREAFKRRRIWMYPLAFVGVFAVIIIIFRSIGFSVLDEQPSVEKAGQFGDSFGYVNALFSALAFAGVILALLVQIAEYHLAQEERDEALETQQTISTQQYFSSVITAVSTWSQLHGSRQIPYWFDWKHLHLDYFGQRKITSTLLEVATDYLLKESLGESDNLIRDFKNDRRLTLARRDVEMSKQVLYVLLDYVCLASREIWESLPKHFEEDGSTYQDFPSHDWVKGFF